MIDSSLSLQKTIRARLIAFAPLTALVAASSIVDQNRLPDKFPLVQIGAGNSIYAREFESFHAVEYLDLHIWEKEPGLETAKRIGAAIRAALKLRPWVADGFHIHSLSTQTGRFLRDPTGEHSHAILSVLAIMTELETVS